MQDVKNGRPHGAAPTNLIHRFCIGGDHLQALSRFSALRFQSTHPLRDATIRMMQGYDITRFQSTHPSRDTTKGVYTAVQFLRISIHAFYAECGKRAATRGRPYEFNPRILHRMRQQK